MKEALDSAIQELKRVDHLFYVSLKYTRTVDVIRSVVERLINALDFGIDSLLKHAKENKQVTNIPTNVGLKCALFKKIYADNSELLDYINFYLKLRKIIRAKYTKRQEYRRHVTMIADIDGEIVEVSIDVLKEYYDKAREFINFIRKTIYGEEEI